MTGEFNIQKFGDFLKSFWGLLASFTVVLPTIIYFLNASQIKSSYISDHYLGIPTTFALLTIPFSFLFEDKLSSPRVARKVAITFSILAFCTLFSFVAIKTLYISNTTYSKKEVDGSIIKIEEKDNGEIYRRTYDKTQTDPSIQYEPKRIEKGVNKLEVLSLTIYTLSIIFLTAAFSGLGVFFYTRRQET